MGRHGRQWTEAQKAALASARAAKAATIDGSKGGKPGLESTPPSSPIPIVGEARTWVERCSPAAAAAAAAADKKRQKTAQADSAPSRFSTGSGQANASGVGGSQRRRARGLFHPHASPEPEPEPAPVTQGAGRSRQPFSQLGRKQQKNIVKLIRQFVGGDFLGLLKTVLTSGALCTLLFKSELSACLPQVAEVVREVAPQQTLTGFTVKKACAIVSDLNLTNGEYTMLRKHSTQVFPSLNRVLKEFERSCADPVALYDEEQKLLTYWLPNIENNLV